MEKIRRAAAASLILLAALGAGARAACVTREPQIVDRTQGYAGATRWGECLVSITPTSTPHLVYRSFSFYDDGLLMVFSSYGEGDNSDTTSAREFYFFPRSGALDLRMDAKTRTITVVMADGGEIGIDAATAQIAAVQRGEATVSPRNDPAERGGVEFPRYAGLMLDAGFARGRSPSARPNETSVFRSAYGQLCSVANREVFAYDAKGNPALKFADAELSAWLKTRCPALSVRF